MIRVWDVSTYKYVNILTSHTGVVYTFESIFFDNTYLIASASKDMQVILWNLDTMKSVATYNPFSTAIYCLKTIDTDGSLFVFGLTDGVAVTLSGSASSSVTLSVKQTIKQVITSYPCNGIGFYNNNLMLSPTTNQIVMMDFTKSPVGVTQTILTTDTQNSMEIMIGKFISFVRFF